LAIVGPEHEPDYSAQVRRRAEELGVEGRVIWHGFTTNPAPLYRAADVFCLPSQNEGMPAALVEAMASGLPSVITAVPGMMELVKDGIHGRVVEPNPLQIADAIQGYSAQRHHAVAHGSAARQKIIDGFSTTKIVAMYERLFQRVMAGQPANEGFAQASVSGSIIS
jgi:glycosyltransferase involved in cell wall biosynthesis